MVANKLKAYVYDVRIRSDFVNHILKLLKITANVSNFNQLLYTTNKVGPIPSIVDTTADTT